MELVFVTEARFVRSRNGGIYSLHTFNRKLWERYLACFDRITVVARVLEDPEISCEEALRADSEVVSFLSLPYYLGMVEFLKKRKQIKALMSQKFGKNKAYILRVPGILGFMAEHILVKRGIPYGVEVVGDPWDVFAPKTLRHPLRPVFRYIFTKALKEVVKKSSAALYVTRQTLQQRYPVTAGTFQIAASNVQIDDHNIATEPKKIVAGKRYELISIGSLAQLYKAPDVVIKAVAELKKRNLNFHLTWLGDGKYKEEMKVLAEKLNVSEQIDFRGNVSPSEVLIALQKSDIFLLASRTEGLPRVVIEAMSCGLPCIATKVGGIPELLDEQVQINVNRPDELADKLTRMIQDPDFASRQAVRNLKEAHQYKDSVLRERRILFYKELIRLSTPEI